MEKDTEEQILQELKHINTSLEHINSKLEDADKDDKPSFIISDIIKSLLIGIVIVGPALAVVVIGFFIVYNWLFG
ncbi:hypothetical protein [Virgibacillus kimchii]